MTRKEFEIYLKALQDLDIYSLDDDAEILEDLWENHRDFFKDLESGLDVDKHRWYELTTSIHKLGDWYVGVRGVTQVYSESMGFSDTGIYLDFFEVERKEVTTYEYTKIKEK